MLAADELATPGSAFAGKSVADVEKFIKTAETEIASMGYEKTMQLLDYSQDERSNLLPYLNAAKTGTALKKEQIEAADQIKAGLMTRFLSKKVANNVASDLNGWRVEEGPVKDAITEASNSGKADLATVAKVLMRQVPREQRKDAVAKLKAALDVNTPSSALFRVDTDALKRTVEYEASRGIVVPFVAGATEDIISRMKATTPSMSWLIGE